MFSCIVLGHCPVTNSNAMHLKLNHKFNCCKNIMFKFLLYSKEISGVQLPCKGMSMFCVTTGNCKQ